MLRGDTPSRVAEALEDHPAFCVDAATGALRVAIADGDPDTASYGWWRQMPERIGVEG